jgi:multidrug resistance protein, MATE family
MKHRTYLAMALPLILSTITTPLLGAVDTAVVGQLPNPANIAAVAIGAIICNTMYWLLGFLRVSTSGFTAQAKGASERNMEVLAFVRPLLIALLTGVLFILIQEPILQITHFLYNPSSEVTVLVNEYFSIRIWGAPFVLMNYVILGWLMGMSKIKAALLVQIFMNLLNIILDLWFVHVFSWGVTGVAIATLISEIVAFVLGCLLIKKALPTFFKKLPSFEEILHKQSLAKMFRVNRDLFIRTLCLLAVFNIFTSKGASYGTEVLAANAVLIQVHYLMAYFYDGFANASSILSGRAVGSKDERLFKQTLKLSFQWSLISSMLIIAVYLLFSEYLFLLFTRIPAVLELTHSYSIWIAFFPLAAGYGLTLYGVFTGATEVAPVRNSMLLAFLGFLFVLFIVEPSYNNHGLWLAFIVFSLGRSVFLAMFIPSLVKKLFPSATHIKGTVHL